MSGKTNLTMLSALVCAAVIAAMAASVAQGGSIWAKGTTRTRMLTADDVAGEVGDILTIAIREKSVVSSKTERSDQKKTSRNINVEGGTAKLNDIAGSVGKRIFDFPQVKLDAASDAKFDGSADYGANRSIDDMITVTVEDVQPNGNMVVIGTRTREVSGDTQTILVSGVVRPSDINFANVVDSDRVADFHVVHKTKGQDTSYTRPGWLTRFVNMISPF